MRLLFEYKNFPIALKLRWRVLQTIQKGDLYRIYHSAQIYKDKMFVFGGLNQANMPSSFLWVLDLCKEIFRIPSKILILKGPTLGLNWHVTKISIQVPMWYFKLFSCLKFWWDTLVLYIKIRCLFLEARSKVLRTFILKIFGHLILVNDFPHPRY